jgi:hypothetical protein
LIEVAFDIDSAVGCFVLLVNFLSSCCQFSISDDDRRAIGIELFECFSCGECTRFVECILDIFFHLHHVAVEIDFNIDNEFLSCLRNNSCRHEYLRVIGNNKV